MRKRTFIVDVHDVRASTGWSDASLVILDYSGKEAKAVTINIAHPFCLAEIRRKLDQIEASWARSLEGAKP